MVKARLTPLLDVTPPPRGRSLEAHLQALTAAIERAWGPRVALVDASEAGNARGGDCARTADGRVHLAYLCDLARAAGLALVPVTGLGRADAYQLAVADAASIDQRGLALRLHRPDLRDPRSLEPRALALLDTLATVPETTDLVLDFGGVTAGHLAAYESTAHAVLAALTENVAWRSVTIAAATQLPADGRGATRGPRTVPRTDWLLWHALTVGAHAVPTLAAYAEAGTLRFGDYGPLLYGPHPVRADGTAEWVGYAHGAEWLVRDALGEIPRADTPRVDEHWDESARRTPNVTREPAGSSRPAGASAWPELRHTPAGGWPVVGSVEPRPGVSERSTWRAAAVTHHLTVAVEPLAPVPVVHAADES